MPPGHFRVSGWVVPRSSPIARVHVHVDGRDAGLARLFSQARLDIAARSPAPSAALAGFECSVRLSGPPGRTVTIGVDAEDLDGSTFAVEPHTVTIGAAPGDQGTRGITPTRATWQRAGPTRVAGTKLAVFTHRLDRGGAQLVLHELLAELLTDEILSCVVVSLSDGPLRASLEALGAEVVIGSFPVGSMTGYEDAVQIFAGVLQRQQTDVVLVNTLVAGIGADVARRLGIPAIWMIKETRPLDELWVAAYGDDGIDPHVRAVLTHSLADVSAVVFETEATRVALSDVCPPGRTDVLHHRARVDLIDELLASTSQSEARRMIGIDADRFVVLNVGTISPHKGQAALAVAFARVAHEHPNADLVLLGDVEGEYGEAFHETIDRLDLGDRIRIDPAVGDPLPWYRAADAFVLPSDFDTMPRTLQEAMAFELPVAATAIGGIPELVVHGQNGLLFPARDLGALVEALRALMQRSAEDRASLGGAASRAVRSATGARRRWR